MNWLRLALWAAVGAAVIATVAAVRSHWIGVGEARVQTRWDAQQRVDLDETLTLERERNADQLIRFKNAERNTDEQARLEALRAQRDRATAAERDGLLSTIAALNGRAVPGTCDAACVAALTREATVARELLGRCAARYTSVAFGADELRDQVIGLQTDATTVCRTPIPAPMNAPSADNP